MPISRSATCSNEWSGSRAWRSWRPTASAIWTTRFCAACATSSIFPLPDEETARRDLETGDSAPRSPKIPCIDIDFLARQFPLSGGHIRSIVFNACLQSAKRRNGTKELYMKDILMADQAGVRQDEPNFESRTAGAVRRRHQAFGLNKR